MTLPTRNLRLRRSAVVVLAVLAMVAVALPASAGVDVAVTIDVIVRLESPDGDVSAVALDAGGVVLDSPISSRGVHHVTRLVEVDVEKVEEETQKEAEDWANDLKKDDRVMWAEAASESLVEDSRAHAWPHGDPGQPGPDDDDVLAYLGLDEAHQYATGSGSVVAVLDTGVDRLHPLLADRLAPGWDLVDDDGDPTEQGDGVDDDLDGVVDDAHGHGTFVAGVVAQIAPDATILPLRVLDADGRGEIGSVVEGVRMAVEMGADVINVSFGFADGHKPKALEDAIKFAKEQDVVVIAAGGNGGDDRKSFPASHGDVLSIGAIDIDDETQVAGFSCRGNWVRFAAPGVDIVSAVPGGGYARWDGTSMAAPVVAGQAALLTSLDPTARPSDIRKAVEESARKMSGDDRADKGVVDIPGSLLRLID